MTEQNGSVADHVVGGSSVVQQQGVLHGRVANTQQRLNLCIGEPSRTVFVSAIQKGVHGRYNEMMTLVPLHPSHRSLVLLQQCKGRQDHVAAAQLILVRHNGRRGGSQDGFGRDFFPHFLLPCSGSSRLGQVGKPAIGLITARPDGTG